MALLRDAPFHLLQDANNAATALDDMRNAFGQALAANDGLQLGLDLPRGPAGLRLEPNTLFRCGLPDEEKGPIVSQFFLHDVHFGTQAIQQMQFRLYKANTDYLTDHARLDRRPGHWLRHVGAKLWRGQPQPGAAGSDTPATCGNMRDLARFVHRDALHQAYFNAALLLMEWQAPRDPGNPYEPGGYSRQGGFGVLGATHTC